MTRRPLHPWLVKAICLIVGPVVIGLIYAAVLVIQP